MQTVTSFPQQVNAELSHTITWLEKMAERGVYGTNAARLKITAIRQLSEVLGEDEPRTAEWFLANLESIGARYANKEGANPDTVRCYVSRARGAISAHFEYLKAPLAFRPKTKNTEGKRASKREAPENAPSASDDESPGDESDVAPSAAQPVASSQPAQPAQAQPTVQGSIPADFRDFVLDRAKGRRIVYQLPESGIEMKEAAKFAFHLLTMCDDFDAVNVQQLLAALRRINESPETSIAKD
jgi:hypothetical protein